MLSHAQIGGFVAMLDLRWPGPLRWFFEVETTASRYVRLARVCTGCPPIIDAALHVTPLSPVLQP